MTHVAHRNVAASASPPAMITTEPPVFVPSTTASPPTERCTLAHVTDGMAGGMWVARSMEAGEERQGVGGHLFVPASTQRKAPLPVAQVQPRSATLLFVLRPPCSPRVVVLEQRPQPLLTTEMSSARRVRPRLGDTTPLPPPSLHTCREKCCWAELWRHFTVLCR